MDKFTHLTFTLLLAAATMAQDLPLSPALERAIAADELEHDLARAKDLLRAVTEDSAAPEAVRRHAWLRVARLQRRMGDDASDALAKAAVGDDAVAVAARELAAQGQADPEREAELQAKAEAAVEKAIQTGDLREAIWFGAAAVPVAIRKFEERVQPLQPVGRDFAGLGPMGKVLEAQALHRQRSAALLWYLPGDRAAAFLREGLQSAHVDRRRALAAGIQTAPELPSERLVLVRLALRDPDEQVVVSALVVGHKMTCPDLLPLCLDAREGLRRPALAAMVTWANQRFNRALQSPELRADSEAIASALPRLLAMPSMEEHRLALRVIGLSALYSRAGRTSLAANLAAVRDPQPHGLPSPRSAIADWDGVTENANVLRAAIVRLGPADASLGAATYFAKTLANTYVDACWDRSALDAVLTTWRLYYGEASVQWLVRYAKDEDAGTIVAGLAGNRHALRMVAPWLWQRDLPEEAFGPLRDALSSAPDWQDDRALMLAIGRTGHRDAAALVSGMSLRADYAAIALQALSWLASKRADAETIAALRAQVAASLPITDASKRNDIAAAVGTLVRLGDPEIVDMFDALAGAFAVVQGLRPRIDTSSLPAGDALRSPLQPASPYDWLILSRDQGTPGMWHGYAPEQYRAIWRRGLAPIDGKHGAAWASADRALFPLPEAAGADPLLVQVILDAAQARLGEAEGTTVAAVLSVLFRALERDLLPASVRARVRELREMAFVAPAEVLREAAIGSLVAPFDADDRARILRGLADPSLSVNQAAHQRVLGNEMPTDREVVEHAFRSPVAASRYEAFNLLRRIRDDVPDLLRGLLADPVEDIRERACVELAQSLRLDAVPSLLEALKDQAPRVREAATQALQSIRFYHDEKAHWDRVFDGRAGLTATSAAAALLEQAKPVNDAATRVLAIRSLGVLAAPETQPFLIEWTKDSNADVAAAAREAVGRIHASKGR